MSPILQAVNASPLHVLLQRRHTLVVRGSGRLRCEAGTVWLTESGRAADAVLAAGEEWRLRPPAEGVLSTPAGARLSIGGQAETAA